MVHIIWFPVLASICSGYMFMSIAPLNDQFMSLFGVGYAGLSLFLSGLLWSHSFVQLPAGVFLDRIGVYRGFLIAIGLALAANFLPFIAPENLVLATTLRFIAGISTGSLFLASVKMIGLMAPREKMAQAQGIQGAAFSMGIMLPFLTLPYLGPKAWPFSYLISAALVIILLCCSTRLPAHVRQAQANTNATLGDVWNAVKLISTSVPIWTLGIFHGLSYGTLNNLGYWLPSILADMSGVTTVAAWSLGTGAVLFVGTLGRASAGNLLKWFSRSKVINSAVLFIAILYVVLGLTGNPYVGLAVGIILAYLGGSNYGSIFSLTSQTTSPAYMATAVGFMNMIGNVTNVLLTLILGNVREYTGSFSMGLFATGLFAMLVWIAGNRIITRLGREHA